MHSKVDAESSFTAVPKRSASSSMRASTREVGLERLAPSSSCPRRGPARSRRASPSCVTETSTSFCSCICSEQSRPPSEMHHSPLPRIWISLWRVCSMLSSSSMFLLSPTPVAFTSSSTSRTSAGTCGGVVEDALALAAAAADRLQAEAPARAARRGALAASSRSVSPSSSMREEVDALGGTTPRARARRASVERQLRRRRAPATVEAVRPWPASASAARSGCLRSSVRAVTSFTPGVTETWFSIAVRLASSFVPAAVCVCEHGPMNLSPASSRRAHELGVLGHEAVAGEDVVVAVLAADRG